MKKMKKKGIITFILSLILVLCIGIAGCSDSTPSQDDPPETEYKVNSVTLQYNDEDIDGSLEVDLSAGTIQLGVSVDKDDEADGTVTYASSDTSVATINSTALVTLLSEGETIISATAGDKSHEIALVVTNTYADVATYTITVIGGTASRSTAPEGEWIELTPEIPDGQEFVEWQFSVDVDVNGNSFRMPASDVTVTAVYNTAEYTLYLVGAKVTAVAGSETVPEGEDYGNTENGDDAEYDITAYEFAYGTQITIERIDEPSGKMFVGWDVETENNRQEAITDEYTFEMPAATYNIWAVFSTSASVWTATSINNGPSASAITNGGGDADLEGMSGLKIQIPGDTGASTAYTENIRGSSWNTLDGNNTMKAIFKNHSTTLPVTVEIFASFFGNLTTSGHVTVQPGEVKTVYFTASIGFSNPWWGFEIREAVGGTLSDTVELDIVLAAADTYPDGDTSLMYADAEYVTISSYSSGDGWPISTGGATRLNMDYGFSIVANNMNYFTDGSNGYVYAQITNMPAYDAENPTTTIYVKVTNMVNSGDYPQALNLVFSNSSNPRTASELRVMESINIEHMGDEFILRFDIPRTATDGGTFYFSMYKDVLESTSQYPLNIAIQMTYNNVMGYEED